MANSDNSEIDDGKTAKERYRDKTKRISVLESEYKLAYDYIYNREDSKPIVAEKPNRLIIESFLLTMESERYETTWMDRVLLYADRHDKSEKEAIDDIMCTVLDDSGRIEETFRKPRLFSNDMW